MRLPVAEGFYPFSKTDLERQIRSFLIHPEITTKALGIIVPHAGYAFSGSVAGKTYASASGWKKSIVLLGPNHTGMGKNIAKSIEDWQTPLGIVKNENRFLGIDVSEDAHLAEHSLEVQIPFLQCRLNDFRINPISLSHLSLKQIESLSDSLVSTSCSYVASSDFTHYGPSYGYEPFRRSPLENLNAVREMDMRAIEMICKIEPERFYNLVSESGMTICGFVPITLLLFICRKLGAKRGHLIEYKTSYDVRPSKDFVAYAGIIIE